MTRYFNLLILALLCSCSGKQESKRGDKEVEKEKADLPEQIVIISRNAPGKYAHLISQDSLGTQAEKSPGPKLLLPHYGFSFLDDQNIIQTWIPEKGIADTLVISWYSEDLELSAYNPFASIEETFLVKNGDTVIFDYENNLPVARIANREVEEAQLNYNRYRLEKLFDNKYSSHHLIFAGIFITGPEQHEENTINHYIKAREDYYREQKLLDSLKEANIISPLDYKYRLNALDVLMEKHKKNKIVEEWLRKNKILREEGNFETALEFDLTQTDSLMKFSFFREHLKNISTYGLVTITENNGNSGSSYIDSRARFDSILKDDRFNQTAKNFLLFDAYDGIGRNFTVRDKEIYFQKLQESTTSPNRLRKLVKDHKIDFEYSNHLLLTNQNNETLTYIEALQKAKGKWLYIDFWASWCTPCRRTLPDSRKLMRDLKDQNVVFLYMALNDNKQQWQETILSDSLQAGVHYFIENPNTSKVLEELGVKTIPHYMIYNPEGEIVQGFAQRPGKGAKEQLKHYLNTSSE